ncbi:MAG: hypothetical protein WCO52_05850 [bacterium]
MNLRTPKPTLILAAVVVVLGVGALLSLYFSKRHATTSTGNTGVTATSSQGTPGVVPTPFPVATPVAIAVDANTVDRASPVSGGQVVRYLDSDGNLKEYSAATKAVTTITTLDPTPRQIQWSPDSKTALLSYAGESDDDSKTLKLLNAASGTLTDIPGSSGAWSMSGQVVYAVGSVDGATTQLIALTPGGGNLNLSKITGQVDQMVISQKDGRIALMVSDQSSDGDQSSLTIIEANGTVKKNVAAAITGLIGWSAEGTLAFQHQVDSASVISLYSSKVTDTTTACGQTQAWVGSQLLVAASPAGDEVIMVSLSEGGSVTSTHSVDGPYIQNIDQILPFGDSVLILTNATLYTLSL